MAGQSVLEQRTSKNDINAPEGGTCVLKDNRFDLDEDTVKELHRKIDVISQPLVLGESTVLYMISTWKEPVTLTFRISVALGLSSAVERGEFSCELH